MSIALTYDEVKALNPCTDSFHRVVKLLGGKEGWNGNRISAAEARAAGCTLNDIVWIASAAAKTNADVERRLRLWMADCAARVLHIYEKTEASDAPRKAIIAARQFARGEIDAAARLAARAAAWAAALATASAAASAAAWATASAAAWDAETQWQFDQLVARLSDDEPEDVPLPERKNVMEGTAA